MIRLKTTLKLLKHKPKILRDSKANTTTAIPTTGTIQVMHIQRVQGHNPPTVGITN
jgi:hypothetical protein